MKYIIGRNNLALTLFVPWDCGRNCPFCTSKKEYGDTSNFSLTKVIESVDDILLYCKGIKDLVITGGEPFADLKQLKILLNSTVYSGIDKYINTTLDGDLEELLTFIKDMRNVSGINVSRHIPTLITEDDKRLFQAIRKQGIKVRINSVVCSSIKKEIIKEFIDSYKDYVDDISFRFDYRKTKTQDDLRCLDNPFLKSLFDIDCLEYKCSGGCHVCNNDDFLYEDRYRITFHRGFESTNIIVGNTSIVNDIIVKQNGDIKLDWESGSVSREELNVILDCFGREQNIECTKEKLESTQKELGKCYINLNLSCTKKDTFTFWLSSGCGNGKWVTIPKTSGCG